MITQMLRPLLVVSVCFSTGCAGVWAGYDGPITMPARVEECRLLDRKVTHYGSLATIGAFLSGGTGLAAAFPENKDSRVATGIVSLASGVFAAWSSYLSTRNKDRYAERNCAAILNGNPNDTAFVKALKQQQADTAASHAVDPEVFRLQRQFTQDSVKATLKFRRDSLKAALQDSLSRLQQSPTPTKP